MKGQSLFITSIITTYIISLVNMLQKEEGRMTDSNYIVITIQRRPDLHSFW